MIKDEGINSFSYKGYYVMHTAVRADLHPWYPRIKNPLDLIIKAIEQAGDEPDRDIGIAIDPTSSGFYKKGRDVKKARELLKVSEEINHNLPYIETKAPIRSNPVSLSLSNSWQVFRKDN